MTTTCSCENTSDSIQNLMKRLNLTAKQTAGHAYCFDLGYGVRIGSGKLCVIAGPCAVEGDNIFDIASQVKLAGANVLRGGAFKPRTSPYTFQGLGEKGLELLSTAAHEQGMPCVSEVMDPRDLELFENHNVDILQIGARNASNYALLKEVGKTNKPVLLKRGRANTIEEFLQSAEYIMNEGNHQVILCERGIRTYETLTRNTFDLSCVAALKKLTHLPVIADASHATGIQSLVVPVTLGAVAAGADGLMVECHTNPAQSVSDADQALTMEQLSECIEQAQAIKQVLKPSCREVMQ